MSNLPCLIAIGLSKIGSMGIRVGRFHGRAELLRLAHDWRALCNKLPSRRHIHYFEWYLALAETAERHQSPTVDAIAVYIDDALVAVFPYQDTLFTRGSLSLRLKRLISDEQQALSVRDFMIAPGLAERNFFEGFVSFLAQNDPSWDALSLYGILDDSYAASALRNSPRLQPYIVTTVGGAWGRVKFISCGENDRPFERLSKGFKQNLRTSRNKLEGRHVSFEVAYTESELLRLYPDFLNVESSGWKGEAETSVLKKPISENFFGRLIAHFGASGCCEIHIMRVDGKAIATLFGIVVDNVWYILRIGYDEAYHRISPGHLILENLLKNRPGRNLFRFLTPYNAPPWFHAWKPDKELKILDAWVFPPSPRGSEHAKQLHAQFAKAKDAE
jgi:hypothetical protein